MRPPPPSTPFPYTTLFRSDDVHPAGTGDLERGRHLVAHRTEVPEHVDGDRLLGELTNRDRRAAQAERRDDHVDAAAVLETGRSEEHTSELQSQSNLVCRLL